VRRVFAVPAQETLLGDHEERSGTMGVFDFLRGKPRDTQEERADIRREAEGRGPEPDEASPDEIEQEAELKRDEEVARHGGI
jgi:hypothetical protein